MLRMFSSIKKSFAILTLAILLATIFFSSISFASSMRYEVPSDDNYRNNCVRWLRTYRIPSLQSGLYTLSDKSSIINDYNARVGSVAIIDSGYYGHVAYVEAVNDGRISIIEANWIPGKITRACGFEEELNITGYWNPNPAAKDDNSSANPSDTSSILDGTYKIVSAVSENMCLDVPNSSSDNFAQIQIWEDNGTNAQRWEISDCGSGYYKITAICSGKCLDDAGWSRDSGTKMIQYDWKNNDNQLWEISGSGDYFEIKNKYSGLYLDVEGGNSSCGTKCQQWEQNGTSAQRWRLVKMK